MECGQRVVSQPSLWKRNESRRRCVFDSEISKVFCESQQNLHGKSFEKYFIFYFFDVSARLKLLAFFATTVELCSER